MQTISVKLSYKMNRLKRTKNDNHNELYIIRKSFILKKNPQTK